MTSPQKKDDPQEERLAALRDGARLVLDENWLGSSTLPSRTLYPHQWSWDSAFIAIGRSWYDQAKAQRELESLFKGQWANGKVPHIVFNPTVPDDAYFPGPTFWQTSTRSKDAPHDALGKVRCGTYDARSNDVAWEGYE